MIMSTLCTATVPWTHEPCPNEAAGTGSFVVNGQKLALKNPAVYCTQHFDILRQTMTEALGDSFRLVIEPFSQEEVKTATVSTDPLDVIPPEIQSLLLDLDRKLEVADLVQGTSPWSFRVAAMMTVAVAYAKAYVPTGTNIDDYMASMKRYAGGKGLEPRGAKGVLNVARAGLLRRKARAEAIANEEPPAVCPGRYAVVHNGELKFYRVRVNAPKEGKWAGRVFVNVYVMASDEEHRLQDVGTAEEVLDLIRVDPQAAAQRYTDELGKCSECGRTLTDEISRSIGRGPICDAKFSAKMPW